MSINDVILRAFDMPNKISYVGYPVGTKPREYPFLHLRDVLTIPTHFLHSDPKKRSVPVIYEECKKSGVLESKVEIRSSLAEAVHEYPTTEQSISNGSRSSG